MNTVTLAPFDNLIIRSPIKVCSKSRKIVTCVTTCVESTNMVSVVQHPSVPVGGMFAPPNEWHSLTIDRVDGATVGLRVGVTVTRVGCEVGNCVISVGSRVGLIEG